MFKAWLPILLIAVVVLGCARSATTEIPPPVIVSAAEVTADGDSVELVVSKDSDEIDDGSEGAFPSPPNPMSKEELILLSETVVRVRLQDMSTSTVTSMWDGSTVWHPILKFRFSVTEYLKGSGANTIVGVVHDFSFYDTEAEAVDKLAWMVRGHDTRWDNREAVAFLDSDARFDLPENWYVLGGIVEEWDNSYSIDSVRSKTWLPEASGTDTSRERSTSDPVFLLDAPGTGSSGTGPRSSAGASDNAPTISLSTLKTLVTALEAKVSTAGGTEAHRYCVQIAQANAARIANGTYKIQWYDHAIGSGLPAGTLIALGSHKGIARPPGNIGEQWFEGPDRDLVRFEVVGFESLTYSSPSGPFVLYGWRFVTERPLPAGRYRFFHNLLHPALACDETRDIGRNFHRNRLDVTPPPRTLHEAFFDPAAIGSGVGADGTNGVLDPASFALGGVTTAVASLKWDSGTVTIDLSPTASLADYAIDFIDVNGTTTLSLTSDNASTTALTWTVPDKPWNAGDLLMLRIHKPVSNDATLSALALSGVDLTFDPATTTYAASVPATTTQTTVTPTLSHDSATYVVKLGGVVDDDGTIPLAAGDNVITIDVTAEDGSTTQTYTVTVTRATPSEPITVTLAPRVEGSETYVNLTIEWNDPQPCDGQYMVALYSTSDYLVTFMGFHPAPATTSLSSETYMWWDSRFFPDRWAGVSCDPSDWSGRRELGRVSLRAAHPDNN